MVIAEGSELRPDILIDHRQRDFRRGHALSDGDQVGELILNTLGQLEALLF